MLVGVKVLGKPVMTSSIKLQGFGKYPKEDKVAWPAFVFEKFCITYLLRNEACYDKFASTVGVWRASN